MSKPFTHKRLVSELTKAGMIVTKAEKPHNCNPHYFATNPKNNLVIEWTTQAAFVPATTEKDSYWDESNPVTDHVTMRHPDTDGSIDLFMDSYEYTIRGAVHLLERAY